MTSKENIPDSPVNLARTLAEKALEISREIEYLLEKGPDVTRDPSLYTKIKAFLNPESFAQTLIFSVFSARVRSPKSKDFSLEHIKGVYPFLIPPLKDFFEYITSTDNDSDLRELIKDVFNVLRVSDIDAIFNNYGKSTRTENPIIHFYETFLAEYDPNLRRARGVWYTPQPVVNFIVRAVDEILKTEFGLSQGLADTSKTTIKVDTQTFDKRTQKYKQIEKEVHRVQILDPATGTGTFLSEVITQIHKRFKGQQGIWRQYVEEHLLPRLHGFEILMASYAMALLQLELQLKETGITERSNQRLRVFLTNSLEESHVDTGTLFASWLSREAREANYIKRDTPVMCVIGNPPYSGISSNKGKWIEDLIEDYKYINGEHFNERKHWLNDDYVKFIRYAQYLVEKNGSGIVAFINPHGFLDNPTFRGMRWNLLKTFDKIYTIDLHGNANRKETTPEGGKDENVFDIQQGVSINLLVKTGENSTGELGRIFHCDLFGIREAKYQYLVNKSLGSVDFLELGPTSPFYFFKPKEFEHKRSYNSGLKVSDLFQKASVGFVTANDRSNISFSEKEQCAKVDDLLTLDEQDWRRKYKRPKDAQSWKYQWAKEDAHIHRELPLQRVVYRPFDTRWTLYTGRSGGVYARPVYGVMKHFMRGGNVGLTVCRQFKSGGSYYHCLIADSMVESSYVSNRTSEIASVFPLYVYMDERQQQEMCTTGQATFLVKSPNLNMELVAEIEASLDMRFVAEEVERVKGAEVFAPIDLLDYIYGVLHSPAYREKYKEFLKIDFPRVPYPEEPELFWRLVELGGELREVHLLKSPKVEEFNTQYPEDGDNHVSRRLTKRSPGFEPTEEGLGRVWINDEQYFEGVPLVAWEFYIGGYQPAQKWLKDRRDRTLVFEDILHYQKIIVALTLTADLMEQIDGLELEGRLF